jgi:hypothetical protein
MTVVELVLATLLASVLMVALMQLLDTTLKLWSRGETQRATIEQAGGVARLLAHDLRSLHGGAQGDLLVEWVTFDLDDDGVREKSWARLRLVRQASAAESSRMTQLTPTRAGADPNAVPALVEVCWVVIPISKQGEERAEGRLLRGERRIGERLIGERQASCFDRDFFDSMQSPPAGALDEVTGSVLWMGLAFASRTTLTIDGWEIGNQPTNGSGSWDAWGRERPDPLLHAWNVSAADIPQDALVPSLPRRVRIELEFETARERDRRTRLVDAVDPTMTSFEVQSGEYLPREEAGHILIDREWMELLEVRGERVRVRRGARGTDPNSHASGAMLHHGARVVTEVPVAAYSEVWER